MRVHHVVHTSVDGGEGLLAIIMKCEDIAIALQQENHIEFVTPVTSPLQLGFMNRPRGYVVPAHRHLPFQRSTEGTAEVLLVVSGHVNVTVYSSGGEWVECVSLLEGDSIVLLKGGHQVDFMLPSKLFEIKQGPHIPHDKEFFKRGTHG